jgi:large conductance mechanosensitive channel
MLKEFREFISRGNVIDLATAVIIGAAFTAIVNSLVNDIIMPIIGILLKGLDFTMLSLTVGDASLTYGNFIQAVINFLIIAFVVFLLVRAVNNIQKTFSKEKEAESDVQAEPSVEEKLLTEIRDLLKAQQK